MEIYKDVIGYEGLYQVSSLGNVKSLKYGKEKTLKLSLNRGGYLRVNLCKKGNIERRLIHQLTVEAFLDHKRCGFKLVVNHIDFNKTNNNVNNLEIVTARENTNRKHIESTSKYTGVHWYKITNKWRAVIVINGKQKHLGYFVDELEASEAYQKELNNLIN